MGIRLYPNTTKVESLEILAGVPAGTYNSLMELKREQEKECVANGNDYELGFKHWKQIHDNPRLDRMDTFLIYGWGKFISAGIADDCSGYLMNKRKIKDLFRINGIQASVELCDGVHWS